MRQWEIWNGNFNDDRLDDNHRTGPGGLCIRLCAGFRITFLDGKLCVATGENESGKRRQKCFAERHGRLL